MPGHTTGVVEVQILKKDRQIGSSKQLTFSPIPSNEVAAVVEVSQIYIHLIRILCNFLSNRRLLGPEVDKLLANVFRDGGESDQINNVRGFEQFFGAYNNPDQGQLLLNCSWTSRNIIFFTLNPWNNVRKYGWNMGEIWVKYGWKLNFFPGSVDFF